MAEHLTKEQIEELQAAFEIFDKDSDGVITIDEMEEVVRSLGQLTRTEEVKDMIDQLDADNNGTVNLHEFLTMMGRKMTAGEEENELRQAFDVFDENSDGFISLVELKAAMKSMGENLSSQEVEKMMEQADSDGDGLVSFDEFAIMMNK